MDRLAHALRRVAAVALFPVMVVVMVLGGCSCGDDDDDGSPDAGIVDAGDAVVDGALDGSLVGPWRLLSETDGDGGVAANGTLELTASGEYAAAEAAVVDGALRTLDGPGDNAVFNYTMVGAALVLTGGPSIPFTHAGSGAAERLTLLPDPSRTLVYERMTHVRTDTFTLTGTVTLAAGASLATPRVALVFLVNPGTGAEPTTDPRDDAPLSFTGDTAPFDLSRTTGALGVQRIVFGGTAFGAIGFVVVYEDGNTNGKLDLPFECTAGDCLRGVSPLVLAYRIGSSAELTLSPYAYMRPGWTATRLATDHRTGTRLGLVSLDGSASLPFDVTVPMDTGVTLPPLEL